MRVGVMIGPERGDSARKVARMIDDVTWAERAGLDTAWVPQIPTDFDALTAVALMGARTERIEIGTAVVPLQTQHPIALARQALSAQGAANGRLALGLGPSHHWIVQDMLGLPYERPAAFTRDYLEVLDAALRGPGPVDVENGTFTVHNPLDLGPVAPFRCCSPRSARSCWHSRASGRTGPCCGWPTNARSPTTSYPVSPRRRTARGVRRRGSSRASRCVCAARRGRRGARAGQPDPRGGRDLAQLPAAPRLRRRPGHRRPVRGR